MLLLNNIKCCHHSAYWLILFCYTHIFLGVGFYYCSSEPVRGLSSGPFKWNLYYTTCPIPITVKVIYWKRPPLFCCLLIYGSTSTASATLLPFLSASEVKNNFSRLHPWFPATHGLTNYRHQSKMLSSKKNLPVKGLLRQVFICLRPPPLLWPNTPHSCIRVHRFIYTVYLFYLFTRGWGRANQREGWRGNSSQSWVENTNMSDCTSNPEALITPAAKSLMR
jgi:hypothetical protein